MKCPLCLSSNVELVQIEYPCFRHLDFATIRPSGRIGQCRICQLLFNAVDEDVVSGIDSMFRSPAYSESRQTKHTVRVEKFPPRVTRSFLQAELVRELFDSEVLSVLDIGCFDGEFLVELNRRFNAATLHGFDVNEHLCSLFPKGDCFKFWSQGLEYVEGEFDLVCLLHSMTYIRDLPYLMQHLKRLMKRCGSVFVQAPNNTILVAHSIRQ